MRAVLSLLLILGVAGCQREPSFDERFDETRNEIFQKAEELDEELERDETGAPNDLGVAEQGGTPPDPEP